MSFTGTQSLIQRFKESAVTGGHCGKSIGLVMFYVLQLKDPSDTLLHLTLQDLIG